MPKPPPNPPTDAFADTVPMIPPGQESGYLETVPLPLANVRPAAPASAALAPAAVTLEDLLNEARRHNRVCPQPTRWLEFYRLIEQLGGGGRLPAPPLTGSAWAATPAIAKRMCFREQLEWAAAHNCLNAAYQYLKGLPEADWHYMG